MPYSVTPEERWQRAEEFRDTATDELRLADRLRTEGAATASEGYYAWALADAVSAIRESLHGYVSYLTGKHYGDNPDLPELLSECQKLELDLGDNRESIRRLNTSRNIRVHLDPRATVHGGQANRATRVARDVAVLVSHAVSGKPRVSPVGGAAADRTPATQGASAPSASAPSASASMPVIPGSGARATWWEIPRRRLAWRLAAALILLAVGATAGVLMGTPVVGSPFALRMPEHSAAAGIATTTPSPELASYVFDGSLLITTPACQSPESHEAAMQIRNASRSSVRFTVGSPDAGSAMFSLEPQTAGQPTLSGVVPASGTVVLYIVAGPASGTYHIEVLAPAGTVQLAASAC